MGMEHKFANKTDEKFWRELPDDLKKKLSIHDAQRIAKPLLDEITRLEKIYLSAVNGRQRFRAAYRCELEKNKTAALDLDDINVTPEMCQAGWDALYDEPTWPDRSWDESRDRALDYCFRAMLRVLLQQHSVALIDGLLPACDGALKNGR